VHVVVGMDEAGDLWLVDLWRERTTPDKWIDALADLILKWQPSEWADETGQIRGSVGPFLLRRLVERGAYVTRRSFPTKGTKSERAQSIRGRMAMRGLNVPKDAPWLPAFMHELLSFPAGKNDDQVDALGLVGQLLTTITAASPLPDTGRKPINVYDNRSVAELMALS
jgi:predicted phage terminase large subunit-like protein